MKQDRTDITVLLDRSGSMAAVADDTIGGFNEFLGKQREAPGECAVTLAQFDDVFEYVFTEKPVKDAPALTRGTFQPRGSTALYDAICKSIDEAGARIEKKPEDERPALVIFVIQTDGFENASRQRTIHDVNERIARQRDVYKWQFVYLGANQDAIAEASKLGIAPGMAMSYGANPAGTAHAARSYSSNIVATRAAVSSGASVMDAAKSLNFTGDQRKEAEDNIPSTGDGGMWRRKTTAH